MAKKQLIKKEEIEIKPEIKEEVIKVEDVMVKSDGEVNPDIKAFFEWQKQQIKH